jgi:galactonate dehydratase
MSSLADDTRTRCGRVSNVESVVVDGGFRNLVFVRVQTDEGLVGVGEATLEWHEAQVSAAVAALGQSIAGLDAGRIEHLWQLMFRGAFWRGGPIHLTALSAIDQALWDIKGKAAAMPVYDLLGGRCRDTLELYANGPQGTDPTSCAEAAAALLARGYRAMKVCPVTPVTDVDGFAAIHDVRAKVAAIREVVGPQVKLAVDLHGRTSPAMALRIAEALADQEIWFLEEPALPDNLAGYVRVAQGTTIPLAGGERWYTRAGFREAIATAVVALIQPDVSHCGGISETRRIVAAAEFAQLGYAPHNPLGPVGTIASAHLGLACPNFVALERLEGPEAPALDHLVRGGWTIADGVMIPSETPGLGIELDWEACLNTPGQPKHLPGLRRDDGSVAEW